MAKKESNKTNIFRIEIFERNPNKNIMDKSKNIKNAPPLFKIKKTNENNKNEIILNYNNKKNEQTIISSITNMNFPIKKNENEESIINNLEEMEETKVNFNFQGNSDDKHWKKEVIQNHTENSGICNNNNLIEIMEEEPKIEDELNKKGSKLGDGIGLPRIVAKETALDINGPKFETNIKKPSLDISESKISADIKGSALAVNWTKIVDGNDKKVQKLSGIDVDIKEQKIYGIDVYIKGPKLSDIVAGIKQQKLTENNVNIKGKKLSEIEVGVNGNRLSGNDIGVNRPILNINEGQINNRHSINPQIDIKRSSDVGSNISSSINKQIGNFSNINYLFYPQNKNNNLEKGKGKFKSIIKILI